MMYFSIAAMLLKSLKLRLEIYEIWVSFPVECGKYFITILCLISNFRKCSRFLVLIVLLNAFLKEKKFFGSRLRKFGFRKLIWLISNLIHAWVQVLSVILQASRPEMLGIHYYVFLIYEKYLPQNSRKFYETKDKYLLPTHSALRASQHANPVHFLNEWTILATTILLPFPLLSSSKVPSALTALKNISRL